MRRKRRKRRGGNHTKRTIVPRKPAIRTRPVKLHATDAAHVVLGHVPAPRRDRVPGLDLDLHVSVCLFRPSVEFLFFLSFRINCCGGDVMEKASGWLCRRGGTRRLVVLGGGRMDGSSLFGAGWGGGLAPPRSEEGRTLNGNRDTTNLGYFITACSGRLEPIESVRYCPDGNS